MSDQFNHLSAENPDHDLAQIKSNEPPCPICGGESCDGECDHGPESYEPADEPNDSMDGDHASALASAGFGTDEDYEHNSIDDYYGGE